MMRNDLTKKEIELIIKSLNKEVDNLTCVLKRTQKEEWLSDIKILNNIILKLEPELNITDEKR